MGRRGQPGDKHEDTQAQMRVPSEGQAQVKDGFSGEAMAELGHKTHPEVSSCLGPGCPVGMVCRELVTGCCSWMTLASPEEVRTMGPRLDYIFKNVFDT